MRQSGTIHSIQALRAVAASLVALFHAQQAFSAQVSRPLFAQESYVFAFGAVGVHIFFVISGLIMVLTAVRPDQPFKAPDFFRRRLLRIYPIYWLCAAAYLLFHALIGKPYHLSATEILGALTLWPGTSPLIIGPAWTLSYEMFFYLCFGFAMTLSFHRGLIALAASFFLAIGVGFFVADKGPVLQVVTNTLLLEFLAGAGIGWLVTARRLPDGRGAILTAFALLLFGAGLFWGYGRLPSAIMWGIPSALLVLGIVTWENDTGAGKAILHLGKLGDSSYVLYLIHILVIDAGIELSLNLSGQLRPAPPLAAALVLIVALLSAEVIHRGVERPVMARLRSRGKSGRPRREQPPAPPLPR